MKIRAEFLNKIDISFFPCANYDEDKVIMIIGGIHGNEAPSIQGTKLVKEFLEKPEEELAQKILEKATIIIIPIINSLGFLAEARSCPKKDVEIEYNEGRVIVKDDEKRVLKIPPGWQDPNRGWDENDTLVKQHLLWLKSVFNPSLMIFNHAWDAPQGRIHVYGEEDFRVSIVNVRKILEKFYRTHNSYGQPWKFVTQADYRDSKSTNYVFWKEFDIPNYVVETFLLDKNSPKIQLAVNLFLLAKNTLYHFSDDEQWTDDGLVKTILRVISE